MKREEIIEKAYERVDYLMERIVSNQVVSASSMEELNVLLRYLMMTRTA